MNTFNDAVIFFIIYSFMGWVLESAFLSFYHKKIINTGFLHGCFCPVYGFGGLLIIIFSEWIQSVFSSHYPGIIISILASALIVTVLEYITGYILEKIFHCKWWDYSDEFANLHGYICLKNSFFWGVLAILMIVKVNPFLSGLVYSIPEEWRIYLSYIILIYLLLDTTLSIIETLHLRNAIIQYASIPVHKYHDTIIRYKRFFYAFPHLLRLNADIINRDVRSILSERFKKFKGNIKNKYKQI